MSSFRLFGKPFRATDYPKSLVGLGIVALGAFLGLFLQDDLLLNYLASLFLLAILVPLLLVVGIIALIKRSRGTKPGKRLRWTAAISASSIVAIIVFSLVWGRIDSWKNNAVKTYVAQLVPVLDQMKAQNGYYPSEIPATYPLPPELLRNFGAYSSDGKEFQFEYIDAPVGWAVEGTWFFTSKDRKWFLDRSTEPAKQPTQEPPKEQAK